MPETKKPSATKNKKKPNVIPTERDALLVEFLKRVGYANLKQLAEYVTLTTGTETTEKGMYLRALKLTKIKIFDSERVRIDLPRVYFRGSHARDAEKKITVSWVRVPHTLVGNDVLLKLMALGIKEDEIETERELLKQLRNGLPPGERFKTKFPKLPDLTVTVKKQDRSFVYAFEIELAKKNMIDMEKTLDNYAKQTQYFEVEYICGNEKIAEFVRACASQKKMGYVKVYTVEKFLNRPNTSEATKTANVWAHMEAPRNHYFCSIAGNYMGCFRTTSLYSS